MTSSFDLVFPIEIAATEQRPVPGDGIDRLQIERSRIVYQDESTLEHVLWTPVAVLGDVLLLPFELLSIKAWW